MAVPFVTVPVPMPVPLSVNVTVPAVTGLPSETVAVRVNVWPCKRVKAEAASIVVVLKLRSRRPSSASKPSGECARREARRSRSDLIAASFRLSFFDTDILVIL